MKTLEQGSTPFLTWLGNWTALPLALIRPLVSIHIGYQVEGEWQRGHVSFGRRDTQSLFYNAAVFLRVMLPFWIGVQIRWAGAHPEEKEYVQIGLGWKLNGRLAALFRVQSDAASAHGVSGPNVGQAIGWEEGTK